MLGKLETVFSYMAHFFLQSWPVHRPGILFLADHAGRLLKIIPLQDRQTWCPSCFPYLEGDTIADDSAAVPMRALRTGQITTGEADCPDGTVRLGAFPVKENDGTVRAVIGLIYPAADSDLDLHSYLHGLEPLILMGYDAYIQHATSEIVMNVNRYDRSGALIKSLIKQIAAIIDKGYCSAVKLSDNGTLLPQERLTTEGQEKNATHLAQILPRFLDKPIKPMVLDDDRTVIFPVYCEGRPLTALFLHIPPEEADCRYDVRDVAFLQEVGEKVSYSILRAAIADELRHDARKKDLLYQLTKKIQASIDVNDVLEEIMNSIHQFYPYLDAELFLTVETNTTLPVKPLSFQSGESDVSVQAYLEGRLVVSKNDAQGRPMVVIAAPLLGKQGIYGVLQLTANELVSVSDNETAYISILAETAGTAFENAQLYQQSRNLIRELRLINQMAQQLNRSLNLDEILQFVTKTLLETFAAEYCAILRRMDDDTDKLVVISSSTPEHVGKVVSSQEGPLADMFCSKQAMILAQPEITPFSLVPYTSLMAVPLLREAEVTGVLLVSDSRPHYFSFDDYKLLEIFGQHTSLAITNAMLHNEVERMVITDNLTGLYSRRYLNDRMRQSLEQDPFGSLILIDIDFFKNVNDTYGHQVGDEVLVQVANVIKHCIRETDIAARWGGEELAVYLPRVDIPSALMIAERIRSHVEKETVPTVTISSGLSKWDRQYNHNMSVENIFHHADIALYEAKKRGRNQIRLASHG
ncbi:sensor domain-containing diguanylate cyclase [Brevibacillus sp. SYP-B805]|uniref:diguanylate cyclase n=1 Tax=Brevibacillus sp. SYP-B805 TaxID=1578199 RepID=UPI0013EAE27E|nr:diguanylate cyclase [Brevibacillus sp. SYP-B805]NGQ97267.1 sensor domain-containing diguanylate cyclase [Brevibacillus sp. SYP-B805]